MQTLTNKQLKVILKDHAIWLKDRTKGRRADLIDVDFTKTTLDLTHQNFQYARLDDSDFSGMHLEGSDFQHAHLSHVRFRKTHLSCTLFNHADCEEANFEEANLFKAIFENAHIKLAIFCNACLEGANMRWTYAVGTSFFNANLFNTDFSHSTLDEADFQGAILIQTCFSLSLCDSAWNFHCDQQLIWQLLGNICKLKCYDLEVLDIQKELSKFAKRYIPPTIEE
jgi:uncharacterized protein YjbI with pentapeptide repeats